MCGESVGDHDAKDDRQYGDDLGSQSSVLNTVYSNCLAIDQSSIIKRSLKYWKVGKL